jgi:nitrite reductase/ring-hydroxylating ferredoxin subunit
MRARIARTVHHRGPTPNGRGETTPALPYPSGWFSLGLSSELRPGTVLTRPCMGEDVVLYRTRDGELLAVRPYCPHLGAHLGAGGVVDGDNLVCPFHKFAFGPDGTCVRTLAAQYGSPPRARLLHFPVREVNRIIYIWRSHDNRPPTWEIPRLPGVGSGRLSCRTYEVATHPQEALENLVDYGHFLALHGFIGWEEPAPPKTNGPFFRASPRFRAKRFPLLGEITVDQPTQMSGLGCMTGTVELPHIGVSVHVWILPTPIGPWSLHLRQVTSAAFSKPKWLPCRIRELLSRLIARAAMYWIQRQIIDDALIWTHKRYEPRPRLTKGDGPIGQYRHWAGQFYPRTTPSAFRPPS